MDLKKKTASKIIEVFLIKSLIHFFPTNNFEILRERSTDFIFTRLIIIYVAAKSSSLMITYLEGNGIQISRQFKLSSCETGEKR